MVVAAAGNLGVSVSLALSLSWLDLDDTKAAICSVADML